MIDQVRASRPLAFLVLLLIVSPCAAADRSVSPTATVPTGQLKIEGSGIELLAMDRETVDQNIRADRQVVLRDPARSVTLPVGRYHLTEIILKNGFRCDTPWRAVDGETKQFSITAEEPCFLRVGGPLQQTVSVVRQGRTISLSYQLLDADGRKYVSRSRDKRPGFVAYVGDRVVGSGSFEYG